MPTYHIKRDKDGLPTEKGICVARIKCPNGGLHSEKAELIEKQIEKELESKFKTVESFSKTVENNNKIFATSAKYMPTGEISPAKLDADGNELRPALTYENYYAGTNKKHFLSRSLFKDSKKHSEFLRTPGSQFDPEKAESLEELVDVTSQQRENGLEGDDREELIRRGADPKAFSPDYRYLITPAGGYLGSIKSDNLSDDTPVSFYEKIPGSNIVSITIERNDKPKIDYGILIMSTRENASPTNLGDNSDVVITAHPGLPSNVNPDREGMTREEKDAYNEAEHNSLKKLQKEGRLNVGEVRKLKGDRDFNLNVVLV